MTVHDDDLLLDSMQRLIEQNSGLSTEIVGMVVRLGGRVVTVERQLQESKRDRASLRSELAQHRTLLVIIVFIFVLAIALQVWRG